MTLTDWFRDGRRIDWPRVLLVALAVTAVVAVGTAGLVSTAAFSPYGTTWEGTSELRTHIEADADRELAVLADVEEYDSLDAAETAVFVFSPVESYGDDEIERIAAFVEAGGTLLVLDSAGNVTNPLLAGLDAEARIDGRVLKDEQHHLSGPLLPIATEVGNQSRVASIDQVTLNYASSVNAGEATVLVATSPYAYLGEADDEIDDDTVLASYPVATAEPIGSGELVVVGDSSVGIDAMIGEPDNRAFLDAVSGNVSVVAFDTSKGAGVPPLRLALLWLDESPASQAILGLGVVLVVALAGERVVLRERTGDESVTEVPGLSPEDRRAYLERRHPEWDAERIDRVLGAFNRGDRERGGDE